jgi:uncharacterized protein (TIGR00369 family)
MEEHYRKLERMYAVAPINRFYTPDLTVGEGTAEVSFDVVEPMHHSGGAMHGSVYFKALDDAAWFAVNSLVTEVFVLTARFEVTLLRPVSEGRIRAVGRVTSRGERFEAEAELFDEQGRKVALGRGEFVRGRAPLGPDVHYG